MQGAAGAFPPRLCLVTRLLACEMSMICNATKLCQRFDHRWIALRFCITLIATIAPPYLLRTAPAVGDVIHGVLGWIVAHPNGGFYMRNTV